MNKKSGQTAGWSWLRRVPNVISGARIAAVPVLVLLAFAHDEGLFGALMLAALVSDIADGLIARSFGLTSPLGATLDSTADALLFPAAAYGAWVFHPQVVQDYAIALALVIGLALLEHATALLRYGRLSSFHTYLSRIAAYALGFFIATLFLVGFVAWLLWVALTLAAAASMEEFLLLWRLPCWRSDVKGLWWLLREGGRRPSLGSD